MTTAVPTLLSATSATVRREWLSHRVNRFLYGHVGLLLAAGVFATFSAPESTDHGVAWFLLYSVLYAVSLSSLLLGLSSAQAEQDELPFLRTQPSGVFPWVLGKVLGLAALVVPSAFLLILPAMVAQGWSPMLLALAAAAAGVCLVMALVGLTVGLWVSDPVRSLILAVACWFVLLFATDLLLILVAGSPWIQAHPAPWVGWLMANPLDAFRITVLFSLERAVFNTLGAGELVSWWTQHAGLWFGCCVTLWLGALLTAALLGASRRGD